MEIRQRILVLLESLIILLSLWMLAKPNLSHAENADVAVLKNRADQMDRHLQNTDGTVDRLMSQVNILSGDISEMHGEERVILGVITMLCGGSLVLQFKGKKGP